jgi:ATP-binding cassette, subfamily B (MDR/TAP), member 1
LIANPKILLLDEATSALDAESELVVQHALDNIVAQKQITTIVIAHRLSTIRGADTINVVVSGEIAEKGTHDELMSLGGYYRALVEKQEGPSAVEKQESDQGSSCDSIKNGAVRQDCETDTKHTRASSENQSQTESDSDLQTSGHRNKITTIDESAEPSLSFKNVRFAYPTRPYKDVLDGFSLDLREGQTVALVGPSGGGKSTTVGLLERFYDPLEGCVEYMGHDLKELNVAWYRDQIGFVGQEPTLFDETIADNVAYGMPGATQEQIEEACRKSYAHDFISKFPNGYQTKCGERGTQLSGGQKQRIAIGK